MLVTIIDSSIIVVLTMAQEDKPSITPDYPAKTVEDLWGSEAMANRSPLDEEVIQIVRELFPDPRLATVVEGLKEFPEKAELVRGIFARSLKQADAEVGVIGLRSEDIVTFVVQMLAGGRNLLTVSSGDFRSRDQEFFYMTANFNHPTFKQPSYNLPPSAHESLTQMASYNVTQYAPQSAFSTMLFVQLKPLIDPEKWNSGVRALMDSHYIETGNELETALISEKFCSIAFEQIEDLLKEVHKSSATNKPTFATYENILSKNKQTLQQKYDYINFILDVLEPTMRRPALVLLFDSLLNRMGVQVAYSEAIAQGSQLKTDTVDEFGDEFRNWEVVFEPVNGQVFFDDNTVLSATPMGEYEDQVLEMLGLSS